MFVLANGAFKSGSTWLFTILQATGYFSGLPNEYIAGPGVGRSWLKPGLVKGFLESGVYKDAHYLAKGHHYSKRTRDTFLAYNEVYVFNIKRDVKDSLVSHYHHLIMQGKLDDSLAQAENIKKGFADYYWRLGRYKAQQIRIYHQVWDVPSPQIYVSSFEQLKNDFDGEVGKIGHFLGFDFSPAMIARLRDETRLENVQKAGGMDKLAEHKRFVRKGLIGEWKNYFGEDILADVTRIEQNGLSGVDLLKYRAIFTALDVRRRLIKR